MGDVADGRVPSRRFIVYFSPARFHLDVLRVKRAHLNAIENCVPFFVIGFLYTQTNPSMLMTVILFLVFVIARLLHAIFYLTARQPFRTVCFFVGAIVNFIMIVQVIRVIIF